MYKKIVLFTLLLFIIPVYSQSDNDETNAFTPTISVLTDGLLNPVGMALLPNGNLLIAEEGTGEKDDSAGVSLYTPEGDMARLISGIASSRDSGDLSGVPLVGISPDNETIYIGYFNGQQLWTLPTAAAQKIPKRPYAPEDLTPAMQRLNNVFLVNPFDITFSSEGRPVVTDATGNGVAIEQDNGTARFFHRFDALPDTQNDALTIEAVPTGITRIADEYYVTLLGGCPYPPESGKLVAIDTERNQRTVLDGLSLPIDVEVASDGTVWVLEFATFSPDASCFTGEGYLPGTGKLSRILEDGTLETVVDGLDFPGAVLPLPDGSLYITEIFAGRVLHVEFDSSENDSSASQYPYFVNVAEQVGLDFRHGAFHTDIFEDHAAGMGAGLCWLDYDNDGWLDLYLVNSHANAEVGYWRDHGGLPTNRLYRNVEGQFTDVSIETDTALVMRGNGCAAADLNNDGWTDIVITGEGDNALLWNTGEGRFYEGADTAGINTPDWNSAIAIADINQDGWLDIFIGSYIDLEKKIPEPIGAFPQDYYGIPDYVYVNTGLNDAGEAVFREVSREVGIVIDERALGAIFSDLDNDGDPDLYIANDGEPNRLYENIPADDDIGFRFVDTYDTSNVNDRGSGMGVAAGDWTGDGRFDLFVTNWDTELNAIYRNETQNGRLRFFYSTYRIGLRGIGNNMTGWGTAIADFDHDTDMDIMTVNGRVPIANAALDAELMRFYGNRSQDGFRGEFREWTKQVGFEDVGTLMARGSAVADYDNDGDLDIAVNTIGGQALLMQNQMPERNWLMIGTDTPVPGLIAEVTLSNGRVLRRELATGSSYLASEDPRLHFGLGGYDMIDDVRVIFPDGQIQTFADVESNQILQVSAE